MQLKYVILLITLVGLLFLAGFILIAGMSFDSLSAAQAAIIGALAGALGGVVASTLSSLSSLWAGSRDFEERLKDRVSDHALELTRMDYELRQKSLELTKEKREFLAPVKVYRELYRALLELHETGNWPDTINELGLLSIFPLGAEEKPKLARAKVSRS